MLLLKYIAKLLKALASEAEPSQLAWGVVLGMVLGLTPFWSLHNLLIVALILILKVNIGMALLSFIVFSGIAYLADPLFHDLGQFLLQADALEGFWTTLYNIPAIALTKFYNTVVLGSLAASITLAIPLYPLFIRFVHFYREHIHARVQKMKVVKMIKSTKLYSVYQKVSSIRGT